MHPPPPSDDLQFSNTTGIFQKKETMWFIGAEVEQETSAPPPKKITGSAPAYLGIMSYSRHNVGNDNYVTSNWNKL